MTDFDRKNNRNLKKPMTEPCWFKWIWIGWWSFVDNKPHDQRTTNRQPSTIYKFLKINPSTWLICVMKFVIIWLHHWALSLPNDKTWFKFDCFNGTGVCACVWVNRIFKLEIFCFLSVFHYTKHQWNHHQPVWFENPNSNKKNQLLSMNESYSMNHQ